MSRRRIVPRPSDTAPTEPFDSVAEAWFWFVQCQRARIEGARNAAGIGGTMRPCLPDDILAVVERLQRRNVLRHGHMAALALFGHQQMLPPPESTLAKGAGRDWAEALEILERPLRDRGIIR